MTEHAVVIAGGGPTGLMLAAELALAGIDVAMVERETERRIFGSRAGGLHARTVEVLDQRGVADRFISQGQKYHVLPFHIPLDLTDAPTRHNYTLGIWQTHTERILADWVGELPVTTYQGRDVTGFTQDDTGVDVPLSNGDTLRAQYLVGCDGGRSIIRKTAGIEFAGWDASISWLIAEVDTTEEPKWGFHFDARGRHAIGKGDNDAARMVLIEPTVGTDREPTMDDIRENLVAIYGTDFGAHNPKWISRFTDMARQAVSYRDRRVLLAGDAAHVHAPLGGQGLNIGVQDAVNLGWKLAQVINRTSPDSLLDTYHAERHPVGARVLKNTMAQVALGRTDERSKALHEMLAEIFVLDEPRRRIVAEFSGLGVHYDLGGTHPLVGRRMPDLDITTADGPKRVFDFLHHARAVFINFAAADEYDIAGWADRVQRVDAIYEGVWELPAIGMVDAPAAVLVRPDGYVAWAGGAGLQDALNTWFGDRTPIASAAH
jgi:3-(3-hydroxy-phenyl)propionate hydroxylase